MKRHFLSLASSTAFGVASAAIAPGSSGNGELFLNVVDSISKVSYALDLGVTMDEFFIAAQQEIGYQRFWAVDSANYASFRSLATLPNTRWSVVALDSTGNLTTGAQRLFTTVRQGDEGIVKDTTNKGLSDGISTSQAGNFYSSVNALGTHVPQADYSVNGDSFSRETDNGRGYYGESGGLTPTLNGNASFNATNALGESSWFYYLTRSSTSQTAAAKVVTDEFDNLGHDGYWGFVKVEDQDSNSPFYNPSSPFAGKYLLSFTMPVYDVRTTASFREFAQGIGRTEYSGGMVVSALDGVAAAAATEHAAGWVTRLGVAAPASTGFALLGGSTAGSAVTAVPEPGTWALLLAGVAGLAARRRASRPRR